MHVKLMTVVAVFLVIGVTGCVSKNPTSCPEAGCPEGTTNPDPGPGNTSGPTPNPTDNETLRTWKWEGCTGLATVTQVPLAKAQAAVPKDFRVVGMAPDTATVNFFAVTCSRAANATKVIQGASYFLVAVVVETKNASWSANGAISRYVLDLYVDKGEMSLDLTE